MANRKHWPFTYLSDIERCPYVASDSEYQKWNIWDDARLEAISNHRGRIITLAKQLMSHEDKDIREVASFTYNWFINKDGTPR